MVSVKILLSSIDNVKEFINIVSGFEAHMDLVYGQYVIDAKSIMGIFSLDLSKPVEFCIYQDEEGASEILKRLEGYLV